MARRALIATLAAALALVACADEEGDEPGAPAASEGSEAERIEVPGAGEALRWGEGDRAVLLAHGLNFDAASWEEQAEAISDEGNLVLALERIGPRDILGGIEYLREQEGATSVALIGASRGADASLEALSVSPDAADRLVTLSVNTTAELSGTQPKLFIASEDEPVADLSGQLAETAAGEDNEALILPGDAHAQALFETEHSARVLAAILAELSDDREERRPRY